MKSILVPVEQHDLITSVLETASLLAMRFESYVEGLGLRSALADILAIDPMSAMVLPTPEWEEAASLKRGREMFERFMEGRGIARASAGAAGLAFGWGSEEPAGDAFVGSHARVFDISVVGRPGQDRNSPRMSTLEAVLFESGRPVLIAPPSPPAELGESIMIAWNGSTETARATALAMPLLLRARRVIVLTVEGGTVPGPTGTQLATGLRRNGIAAEARTVPAGDRSAGEAMLANATSLGCDLVIKGAYTQSRLRQMIFGGATSHILAHARAPVFMAH